MPFNIFDTYYLAGMVQEIVPAQSFFLDRYFPTNTATDIFDSNKVLVEYRDRDRAMAPFVVRRAGDIPIARGGYEIHEIEPTYIAPSRMLTMDDLQRRGFGEALIVGSTPQQRAQALQVQDLEDLENRIRRREEWMAAQTMINNGLTFEALIDNGEAGEPYDIYFYDTTSEEGNPALYTVETKWDNGGDFRTDIEAMVNDLLDRGLPATDLIVGTDVAAMIQDDEKLLTILDNRRAEYGRLAPDVRYPGVAWIGNLNFGGTDLDIYAVRETVVENGVTTRLFPSTSAMVTAPNCGHMMYGRIDQMEDDQQIHSYAMKRVPKFVADKKTDSRSLRLASRPLAAPYCKAPWIYAPDCVG
ncbi:MAG: major capsid protein [Coriobacteriaceae bacterium]|nr:major capsid protein [Coriobacteriaceae bacterium]